MSAEETQLGETELRVVDILAGVFDALVDDVAWTYVGPDAATHAKNQAERELHDMLVDLVRARRLAPLPE